MGKKSSPSPPPAPDYAAAAEQTGASNLEAARAQMDANRINQYTPYGSMQYWQDPNATSPDKGWNQITMLSPDQQKLLDGQNQASLGLSNLMNQGVGYVRDALGNNITKDSLPGVNAQVDNLPGQRQYQTYGDPYNDAYNQQMARFRPDMEQSDKALQTQLANQGIMSGSEAYDNAMRTQNQGKNDLMSQAALNSIQLGNQQQDQQFKQENQYFAQDQQAMARQQQQIAQQNQQMNYQNQQLGLQTALQNNPINVLNAVRSGSQVTNPTFGSTPQQQNAGGVDYMGAMQGQNNYNMGLYNSQVGAANSANGGLMGMLGTGAMAAATYF